MPTLIYSISENPHHYMDNILHQCHAYWVESLAVSGHLTVRQSSIFEGHHDLLISGPTPHLIVYLQALLQKGICGLHLEVNSQEEAIPFQVFEPAITIMLPTQ